MADLIMRFRDMGTSHQLLWVAGGAVVTVVSVMAAKKLLKRKEKKVYPRDTVILHQIGRGPYAPSMTPFAVKLETYLRMARIPYENVHDFTPSSKGKFPWIEYNDEAVADSSLCIDYLNSNLGINLNLHLSPVDKAIAHSMKIMTEEHLYWFLVLFRWQYDNDKSFVCKVFKIPRYIMWMIKRNIRKVTWAQGLGRHSQEEVTAMMHKDLKSLSDFLGTKKFLFGFEACEEDCSVFGMLSQLLWQSQGTGFENTLSDEYPNLAAYCERMKASFWPDWDKCITHGCTREATK